MNFINVKDQLPTEHKLTKYRVKARSGLIDNNEIEMTALGKMTSSGFKFIVHDQIRVTHWKKEG